MRRFTHEKQTLRSLVRGWVRGHLPYRTPDPYLARARRDRIVNTLLVIAAALCFALLFDDVRP